LGFREILKVGSKSPPFVRIQYEERVLITQKFKEVVK